MRRVSSSAVCFDGMCGKTWPSLSPASASACLQDRWRRGPWASFASVRDVDAVTGARAGGGEEEMSMNEMEGTGPLLFFLFKNDQRAHSLTPPHTPRPPYHLQVPSASQLLSMSTLFNSPNPPTLRHPPRAMAG